MPHWLASAHMWHNIFVPGVPLAEKILRPALVYLFLVVALRVFGKRELAQLNPFDLVVLLSLSTMSIVTQEVEPTARLTGLRIAIVGRLAGMPKRDAAATHPPIGRSGRRAIHRARQRRRNRGNG